MYGVGRGRGAVMPAWMKAQSNQNPAAPGAAAQEATPALPDAKKTSAIGHKRAFDTAYNTNAATSPAASHRPPVEEPLPPGWQASFDPNYQRTYYYNYSTGERTWTKPMETQKPKPNADVLPPSARWETAIDPGRGRQYFYNHAIGETAWTLPEGATLLKDAKRDNAPSTAAAPLASAAAPPATAKRQKEEEEPEEGEVGTAAAASQEKQLADNFAETKAKTTTTTSVAVVGAEAQVERPEQRLPIGWEQAVDPGTGATYYYNQSLNITQWRYPSSDMPSTGGSNGSAGGGGIQKPTQPATNPSKKQLPALDPMDPSSYSDTPRGGWGAGLGKETPM